MATQDIELRSVTSAAVEGFERLPPMQPLLESNRLIGDRRRLDEAWERDGYWFFRDVIDQAAVARIRQIYLDVLAELGQVEPGDQEAVWTGKGLDAFPEYMKPLQVLTARSPWREFLQDQEVNAFFHQLFGEPVVWMPMAEMRAIEPGTPKSIFIHQDGFYYNGALPVRTVWFPLGEIPEEVGGFGLVEGMHRKPYIHDLAKPPMYDVDWTKIPADSWRSAAYRPGDVVMFDQGTPHFGIPNRSDRFRLSLDIRMAPVSAPRPSSAKSWR